MKLLRRLRYPLVLILLAGFLLLFIVTGEEWITPRKATLAPHFSTSATHIFPKTVVALAILALTALFGRWYCSLLCPAGLLQEAASRLGQRLKISRLRYQPGSIAGTAAPVLMLAFVVGMAVIDNFVPADNMDPVGLFGRFGLALGDFLDSWRLGEWGFDALYYCVFAIAATVLIVVPLFRGRWFCATLCLVSGQFHLTAKLPDRRMAIVQHECVACGRCERVCPTGCIDTKNKAIEAERCVLCLRCLDVCPRGGIRYGQAEARPRDRRLFLDAAAASVGAAAYLAARQAGPHLAFLHQERPARIAPPGSGGDARHRRDCITCHACVRSCPVGIIRPLNDERRPTLDFSRGYCQYNCVDCSTSCPAGVFRPLKLEDKHRLRIAATRLVLPNCVVVTNHQECGACAEVCPTHAVAMREVRAGEPTVPDFDAEYCIGCGACYHVCPAYPRAFVVTGLAVHQQAKGVRPIEHPGETPALPPQDADGFTEFPF